MRWQFCHRNTSIGDPEFVKLAVMACVACNNFCLDFSLDADSEKPNSFIHEELERQEFSNVQLDEGGPSAVAKGNVEFLANILHRQ